ncbi:hypothetical protein [Paenibacillus campinasensis]|nr:hypothetical protein [Paenibacillus campinasensis]
MRAAKAARFFISTGAPREELGYTLIMRAVWFAGDAEAVFAITIIWRYN